MLQMLASPRGNAAVCILSFGAHEVVYLVFNWSVFFAEACLGVGLLY